jgi:ketosteroid isomerase-like protein
MLILMASVAASGSALADNRQQDHNAIVQTRELALQAINTRDFSKIKPYLHPTFTITTVDNHIFSSADEFEKYWNQQLSGPVKAIDLSVKVDAPTTFLSTETGVAHGDASSTFHFADGNVRGMAMRWTAVMQKSKDKWTIQSLHFSANLLDNPVLGTAQQLGLYLAIGTGVGGLLLGGAVMAIISRRKPQQVG